MKKPPYFKKERLTNQKKVILDCLKSVKTHPSAEKIFLEARKKLPQISQATVYRILDNLKKKNEIQIIPVRGVAHFDANIILHGHFICQKCGKIYDIFDICSDCSILKSKKTKVGKINSYKIYFYGECKCHR